MNSSKPPTPTDGNQSIPQRAMQRAGTQPPENSRPPLQREAIAQLFSTLQLIYKDRFIKAGENLQDVMKLWSYTLRATPDHVITEAAAEVMNYHPSYPPLIGEFMKVIKDLNKTQPGGDDWHGQPQICVTCHSYKFTQHHKDLCE